MAEMLNFDTTLKKKRGGACHQFSFEKWSKLLDRHRRRETRKAEQREKTVAAGFSIVNKHESLQRVSHSLEISCFYFTAIVRSAF